MRLWIHLWLYLWLWLCVRLYLRLHVCLHVCLRLCLCACLCFVQNTHTQYNIVCDTKISLTRFCIVMQNIVCDTKSCQKVAKLCQRFHFFFGIQNCVKDFLTDIVVCVCARVRVDDCVQPAVFVWIGQYFEESDYFDDAACDHFALLAVLHMYMCMYTLYVCMCVYLDDAAYDDLALQRYFTWI